MLSPPGGPDACSSLRTTGMGTHSHVPSCLLHVRGQGCGGRGAPGDRLVSRQESSCVIPRFSLTPSPPQDSVLGISAGFLVGSCPAKAAPGGETQEGRWEDCVLGAAPVPGSWREQKRLGLRSARSSGAAGASADGRLLSRKAGLLDAGRGASCPHLLQGKRNKEVT